MALIIITGQSTEPVLRKLSENLCNNDRTLAWLGQLIRMKEKRWKKLQWAFWPLETTSSLSIQWTCRMGGITKTSGLSLWWLSVIVPDSPYPRWNSAHLIAVASLLWGHLWLCLSDLKSESVWVGSQRRPSFCVFVSFLIFPLMFVTYVSRLLLDHCFHPSYKPSWLPTKHHRPTGAPWAPDHLLWDAADPAGGSRF